MILDDILNRWIADTREIIKKTPPNRWIDVRLQKLAYQDSISLMCEQFGRLGARGLAERAWVYVCE